MGFIVPTTNFSGDAKTSKHASNSANGPQTPMDPLEKASKSKKKKPRMAPASDIGHTEEVDLSQSASTPEEPHAPSSTPPANPHPARFRMKQPIIRPPSTATLNPKEPQAFTFMPTPGFRPPQNI
ncbi:hypothetical protein PIB30_017192 [Stylosanthes scabra]|uniref:Uncharacterized protein n=1 Tax=Stylosanthes scabra TaxID=79078 RepID=A0ABU6X7A0_9FABA|nr:hypothetical protein [Stylosanthes scabra]